MNYTIAIVQLPLIREAADQDIHTPAEAYKVCCDMAGLAQECLHVLSLNGKNRLLNRHMVSLGSVNSCLIHPREVFRPAITDGATAVVIVHNHTSGEVTPSAEDLKITRQIVEAGRILDIKVLDHVIIGRSELGDGDKPKRPAFMSLRESGICEF